jgi:hypothetical protein
MRKSTNRPTHTQAAFRLQHYRLRSWRSDRNRIAASHRITSCDVSPQAIFVGDAHIAHARTLSRVQGFMHAMPMHVQPRYHLPRQPAEVETKHMQATLHQNTQRIIVSDTSEPCPSKRSANAGYHACVSGEFWTLCRLTARPTESRAKPMLSQPPPSTQQYLMASSSSASCGSHKRAGVWPRSQEQ